MRFLQVFSFKNPAFYADFLWFMNFFALQPIIMPDKTCQTVVFAGKQDYIRVMSLLLTE